MLNKPINFTDLPAPSRSLLAVIRYCSEDESSAEHNLELTGLTWRLKNTVTECFLGSPETAPRMLGIKGLTSIPKRLNSKPAGTRLKAILKNFEKNQDELRDDTTMLLLERLVT